MSERCIFSYLRMGCWILPCHRVEVIETEVGGVIRCRKNREDTTSIEIDEASVKAIKAAMKSNLQIYSYRELEEPMNVYDGFENWFTFSPEPDLSVELHSSNLNYIEEKDRKWMIWQKNIHDVYPEKVLEVVKVFDEIARVLRKNGVEEKYLKL